jgi:ketosteroid isomerase-like protein
MSWENVEIVRRYLDEVSREPSERVGEFWETDSDYYPARKFPEARPCHGRKEIVRFITEYLAAWEDYRYLVKDARAVGDDRVLVHGCVRAEGRGSGVPLEGDIYWCYWLRHGRFIRVEDHLTEKGALHALGLSGDTLEAAGLSE